MSSTNTIVANAAPAIGRRNTKDTSKPSSKRLRASSETYDKTEEGQLQTATPKSTLADNAASPACDDTCDAPIEQLHPTKASLVEALLTREGGASLETLCVATGWQSHTCRAFLTGLRKKGREVIRARDEDGKSIYLIAPDRSSAPLLAAGQAGVETA